MGSSRRREFRFPLGLACIALLLGFDAIASAQEYGFDVWSTANGLPQNTVTGVVQTPDGYLWVSTFDGLARFDGVRFTIFDNSNTKGIVNNRFSWLFADQEGSLWTFTASNVLTVYRNGVFTSYPASEALHEDIRFILPDAKGNALIETDTAFYYLQDGKFVGAPEQKGDGVRQVYFGKSGARWVFERNQISRQKDGALTTYPFKLAARELGRSNSLQPYEDSQGALWISTLDSRLCRLKDGAVTVFTTTEDPALARLRRSPIIEDADGSLWCIYRDRITDQPSQFVRFKDNQFTSYAFREDIVASAGIIDREGDFWLATTLGLRRWRRQLITTLSVKDGLNTNQVYSVLQTRGGDILIGGDQGVNRFADGKITNLGLNYSPGSPLYVTGLWEDGRRRLWVGFLPGLGQPEAGLIRDGGQIVTRYGASDFTSDRAGNIWVANTKGIYKYKDDREVAHYTVADGLPNDNVITIHEDRQGRLWAGTFDGLAQFKDGRFINYNADAGSPRGYVRAIYEDADGVLWFGTYSDGLVRYRNGTFFNYRVEQGLFNNGVFAILEDNHGTFWMSSNRGIHRVSKQELDDLADGRIAKLNSVSYDQSDGMLSNECNGSRMPAGVKTKAGKLWFPTMGGVAIVDPEAVRVNPNPPPVVIENISIDRKPVEPTVLQSAIRNSQFAIDLSPGQSQLEISYTGLSLIKSEQVRFKYQLEGLEKEWVEAGTRRTAYFSYLPAGNYTFHVIAANANGVWNNQGAVVRIVVHPHFYRTWWSALLAILFTGVVVWLIYQNRVSNLRTIAETKTTFSRQLIESQEAERKRIAADLHDGLGQNLVVIKNRAMLGIKEGDDPDRVAKELGSISESASQALEEVREITNNLRPQLLDRLGLTRSINAMLKKVSGVIEVRGEIDPIDDIFAEAQAISVYRIVQESLNNVIKHSGALHAKVNIRRTGTEVLIRISDDGKGFDIAGVSPDGGGFGLAGLKERAQLLNGTFVIDSRIGAGTSIEVVIPLRKARK